MIKEIIKIDLMPLVKYLKTYRIVRVLLAVIKAFKVK